MGAMYERYSTMKFEIDDENKQFVPDIIAARQRHIGGLESETKNIMEQMKKECPDLSAKLLVAEKKLKIQKKYLKETVAGLKGEPYTVIADVICQPSNTPGYIEFVENSGTGCILRQEPGTEDDIRVPVDETEAEI